MTEPITPETEEPKIEEQPEALEATQVEEPVEDNSDAEMDAVLDRLLGIDKPESTRVPASTENAAPDHDMDRALKALQRDGVPANVIDGLKSNPSELKAWGLKAAKRQADVDAFGAKVASDRKTEPNAVQEPKASVVSDDKESDADPLSEFGEIFGDEAVKPLKTMQERLRREFEEKTRMIEVSHQSQMAYQRIASEYGSKAPDYKTIAEEAARIGRENPSKFDSVEAIVKEAFRQKAGEPRKTDPRSIARPSVGKAPVRAAAKVDKDDMALDILLSGGTRDDVRRILSR
jgi:hypothetical protein